MVLHWDQLVKVHLLFQKSENAIVIPPHMLLVYLEPASHTVSSSRQFFITWPNTSAPQFSFIYGWPILWIIF